MTDNRKVLELRLTNLESRLKMMRNESSKASIIAEIEKTRIELRNLDLKRENFTVPVQQKVEEKPKQEEAVVERFQAVEGTEELSVQSSDRGKVFSNIGENAGQSSGANIEVEDNTDDVVEDNNNYQNNKKKKH